MRASSPVESWTNASASPAPASSAASTAWPAILSSSAVAISSPSSDGGAADGHLGDPHVSLADPGGHRLAGLAAKAGLNLEVPGDAVDPAQRREAVADQGRAPA